MNIIIMKLQQPPQLRGILPSNKNALSRTYALKDMGIYRVCPIINRLFTIIVCAKRCDFQGLRQQTSRRPQIQMDVAVIVAYLKLSLALQGPLTKRHLYHSGYRLSWISTGNNY